MKELFMCEGLVKNADVIVTEDKTGKILTLPMVSENSIHEDNDNNSFFIAIQSYDINGRHITFDEMLNKKIKLTLEIL